MEQRIDVRGLPCPQPVILTKKAMESSDIVHVLISGEDQVENVVRMAERSGWSAQRQNTGSDFEVILHRNPGSISLSVNPEDLVCSTIPAVSSVQKTIVFNTETMGHGADELGRLLARVFINTLKEIEPRSQQIVFYNTGVKLVIEGSPVLAALSELQSMGIDLVVCGTCLDYFKSKDKIKVGRISNMHEIASLLLQSSNTIVM